MVNVLYTLKDDPDHMETATEKVMSPNLQYTYKPCYSGWLTCPWLAGIVSNSFIPLSAGKQTCREIIFVQNRQKRFFFFSLSSRGCQFSANLETVTFPGKRCDPTFQFTRDQNLWKNQWSFRGACYIKIKLMKIDTSHNHTQFCRHPKFHE